MAEKKSGFFGKIAKRLSGSFKKNQKNKKMSAIKAITAIKSPTEEKSAGTARPVIRSEIPGKMEPLFATASLPSMVESKPKPIPQPEPVFKKIVKPTPKPVPKKKKRKRYPNEKSLKRVFKMGQYLSKVRQRRHKIRKALKAKTMAKTLKIRIKKTKKKTRLTKKAVKILQQEMRALNPKAPLPGEEKEPFASQFLPGATTKEETNSAPKEENKWGVLIEKKETEPETGPEIKPMVSMEFPNSEPPGKKPEEEISLAIIPEITPIRKAGIEKPGPKPTQKETVEKQEALEAEIRAEIKKQRETPQKKPRETKKATVSIGEKTKPKPKEAIALPKKETRPAKDEIEELQQLIAKKFGGKVAPQQIQELQQKVRELLEQKMVTKSEIEQNIQMVDANRLLEGFTKLLGLIEWNERFSSEKPPEMPSTIGMQRKPEKFAGTEKELEKKELITDFDKILEIVRERGTITLNELASELDLDKRLLKEAVDILEENNLVIQEYPAFGSPRIIDPAYLEKKGKKSEKE